MLSLENTEIHYPFSFRNGVSCDLFPLPNSYLILPRCFAGLRGACGLFIRLLSHPPLSEQQEYTLGQLCMVLSGPSWS
jgi:hypothetical protein